MTPEKIQELIDATLREIQEMARKGNLTAVMALTKKAAEYEDVKKTLLHLQERLKEVHAMAVQSPTNGSGSNQLRELPVEVSAGMIRQNLLTLTRHVKQRRIRISDELTIEAQPSGERFQTQLLEKGNKLRERGAIARFYRDAGVSPGDFVVLSETAPSRWTLKKAAPGRYQSTRSILESL
jgi:hypothetical protein